MSKYPINYATLGQDPWGTFVHDRFPEGLVGQVFRRAHLRALELSRESLDEYAARSHRLAAASDFSARFSRSGFCD